MSSIIGNCRSMFASIRYFFLFFAMVQISCVSERQKTSTEQSVDFNSGEKNVGQGWTKAQVREALGNPTRVRQNSSDATDQETWLYLGTWWRRQNYWKRTYSRTTQYTVPSLDFKRDRVAQSYVEKEVVFQNDRVVSITRFPVPSK